MEASQEECSFTSPFSSEVVSSAVQGRPDNTGSTSERVFIRCAGSV